ncbi:MAG TPA: DUF5000 domain-containing lipoprotein [Pedobacter sp.]|uniref:DUF5000 domain-containing lipoprotein n=1 Tax=Pedobacter sp. TaxID=1411316 RepID=UPI002CCADE24|nr:DUF5000 domain-containing lipoprotein [Pedobacter sp.]HMI05438.1 DUF5000 domain-containing lipoprotein [Pedobacter sp.]
MYDLKNFIVICLMAVFITACKEDLPQSISKEGATPRPVTNVVVKNLPGGATLRYKSPDSEDLLYVKAVYEFPKGNIREVKASMYIDSLTIDGIGNTDELDVKLFTISRSEAFSEPVTVKIKPLTPPVKLAGETLSLIEDFGGVTASFENKTESNLVITIVLKDGNEWLPIETYYTNRRAGSFSARGQEAKEQIFGVFIKDRWNNRSDTLKASLTPIFETRLPAPESITSLYNDYNQHYLTFRYTYLFDGIVSFANYVGTLLTATSKLPLSFTIDFKVPTQFSRFKFWMRGGGNNYDFNFGAPEKWEVWGANELDADWSKWTKILDCTAIKPSGAILGVLTTEDLEAAKAGLDFQFPLNTPKYRYLRWKTTKNFGSVDYVQFSELTFWGNQK